MYIRKLVTRRYKDQTYYGHRLVHQVRVGNTFRQVLLMNLGARYRVPPQDWPLLCKCIQHRLNGEVMLPFVTDALRAEADRITERLLRRYPERLAKAGLVKASQKTERWMTLEVDSQKQVDNRSVGVEQVALWALDQVGFRDLLEELKLSFSMQRAIMGLIVGRMAYPDSERETFRWLREDSALGELLQTDYEHTSLQQLYRASDSLVRHRKVIEQHCYTATRNLFGQGPAVTLLDLTNTYLEGSGTGQDNARYGHSKEKRSDCPLITLALVLDGNGFVQRSRVYPGNVREFDTMKAMLTDLQAPEDAIIIMDRGIATQANLTWLQKKGYRYLVVSRSRSRVMDSEKTITTTTRSGETLELYEETQDGERYVYCRSAKRVKKEEAILRRQMHKWEAALQAIHEGLSRPRTRKRLEHIHQRIGRLKALYPGVAPHYKVTVIADSTKEKATEIRWERDPKAPSRLTHPGVYALRTNVTELSTTALWHTYVMLTDLEAAFRSLKSELGLRPIFHQKDKRTEGHLLITTLAYHMVRLIRYRLRDQAGLTYSWASLRKRLRSQTRSTRVFKRQDGATLHSRVTSTPTPIQAQIYQALDCKPCRLGIQHTVVPKGR